jgi:hypothetical protein
MKPTKIIIHVEGGLVQGVIANCPVNYVVADTDCEGAMSDDISRIPKALKRHIGTGRMNRIRFEHEAAVDPVAVARTLQLTRQLAR